MQENMRLIKEHALRGKELLDAASKDADQKLYDKAVEEFTLSHKYALLMNNDRSAERSCLFNLGAAYIAAGYHDKGTTVLTAIIDQSDSGNVNKSPSQGDLYFNLAYAQEKCDNVDDAIKFYKEAIINYRLQDRTSLMLCEAILNLGNLFIKKSNPSEAIHYFTEATNIYLERNKYSKACNVILLKIKALLEMEDIVAPKCFNLLKDMTEYAMKVKDNKRKCAILCDIALQYTLISCYQPSLSCFETALKYNPDQNRKERAVILQNMGAVYNRIGDYENAISLHKEAADIHGELLNRNAQGQSFCNLAFAYSQHGKFDYAHQSFSHALQAFKDTNDKFGQYQVHEGLAAVAVMRNNFNKAVKHYQIAITLQALTKEINLEVQNRLVRKLTHVLALQAGSRALENGDVQSKPRMIEEKRPYSSRRRRVQSDNRSSKILSSTPIQVDAAVESINNEARAVSPMELNKQYKRNRREHSDGKLHYVTRGLSTVTSGTTLMTLDRKDTLIGAIEEVQSSSTSSSSMSSDDDDHRKLNKTYSEISRPSSSGRHQELHRQDETLFMPVMSLQEPYRSNKLTEPKSISEIFESNSSDSNTQYTPRYREQLQQVHEFEETGKFNVSNQNSASLSASLEPVVDNDPISQFPPKSMPRNHPPKPPRSNIKDPNNSTQFLNPDEVTPYAKSSKKSLRFSGETLISDEPLEHTYQSLNPVTQSIPSSSNQNQPDDHLNVTELDHFKGKNKSSSSLSDDGDARPLSDLFLPGHNKPSSSSPKISESGSKEDIWGEPPVEENQETTKKQKNSKTCSIM